MRERELFIEKNKEQRMPTLPWARGRLAPVCQPAFCMPSVVFPGAASSVRIAPSLSALPLTPLPPPPARLPRRIRQFYVYMLAVKAPEFSVCIFFLASALLAPCRSGRPSVCFPTHRRPEPRRHLTTVRAPKCARSPVPPPSPQPAAVPPGASGCAGRRVP